MHAARAVLADPLYRVFFVVLLVSGFATGGAFSFVSLWGAQVLGADASQVGLLRTISGIVSVVFGLAIGYVGDRTRRRAGWIVGGMALSVVGWLGVAAANEYRLGIVAYTLAGIGGYTLIFALLGDWLRYRRDPNATAVNSTIRLAYAIGWVAGPAAAGLVVGTIGYGPLFLGTALLQAAAVLLALRLRDAPAPPPAAPPAAPTTPAPPTTPAGPPTDAPSPTPAAAPASSDCPLAGPGPDAPAGSPTPSGSARAEPSQGESPASASSAMPTGRSGDWKPGTTASETARSATQPPTRRARRPDQAALAALWLYVTASFLASAAMPSRFVLLPLYLTDALAVSVALVGVLFTVAVVWELPLFPAVAHWAERHGTGRLLALGFAAYVLYFAILALSPGYWPILLLELLFAFWVATNNGVGMLYVQGLAPARAGTALGLYGAASQLGGIASAPLLGYLATQAGWSTAFVVSTAIAAAALAACLVSLRALPRHA